MKHSTPNRPPRAFSPEIARCINGLIDRKADVETARRQLVPVCRDAEELERAVKLVVRWLWIGGR